MWNHYVLVQLLYILLNKTDRNLDQDLNLDYLQRGALHWTTKVKRLLLTHLLPILTIKQLFSNRYVILKQVYNIVAIKQFFTALVRVM